MPVGAAASHLFLCAVCPCAILKKSAVCLRVEVRTLTRLAAFGGRRIFACSFAERRIIIPR